MVDKPDRRRFAELLACMHGEGFILGIVLGFLGGCVFTIAVYIAS